MTTQEDFLKKLIETLNHQKIPYMLVVGDKEVSAGAVSVRHRREGDMGPRDFEEFISRALLPEIENRSL